MYHDDQYDEDAADEDHFEAPPSPDEDFVKRPRRLFADRRLQEVAIRERGSRSVAQLVVCAANENEPTRQKNEERSVSRATWLQSGQEEREFVPITTRRHDFFNGRRVAAPPTS